MVFRADGVPRTQVKHNHKIVVKLISSKQELKV